MSIKSDRNISSKIITPLKNRLLSALTIVEYERLFPCLELVKLKLDDVIYESGDKLHHVYFPVDAVISLSNVIESGSSAEISIVGNEGVIGIALFMGGESTLSRAVVKSAGYAYRIKGRYFMEEFNRHGKFLSLMLRYTQALITQMSQTAVCNRYHTIEQQLCRLLLLLLDRLPDNKIEMTQELIANMLGVRREGVTEAAGKLHKLGVINYHRGHIIVLDKQKLENLSCECYSVVKKETERLLPNVSIRI
jgi:CRP-like cAMP-binding protein